MIKKVLLIAAFIIFAVSCGGSPTDSTQGGSNNNNNSGNTGNGGNTNTTDPNKISEFLKNHEGRYYNVSDAYSTYLRVENGKIYFGQNKTEEVFDKISLSGNDITVETKDQITIYNFDNNVVNVYSKIICQKEVFSAPQNLVAVNILSDAAVYSGNYYVLYSDGVRKDYYLAIGPDGQIYSQNHLKDFTFTLNGNKLTATGTDGINTIKNDFTIENNKLIIDLYGDLNGNPYPTNKLDKSDLLTPYIGTYTRTGVTLVVDEVNAVINGQTSSFINAVLTGKTITIYEEKFGNYTTSTIVFNDDKKTATYTKPDGSTVELTKQIA